MRYSQVSSGARSTILVRRPAPLAPLELSILLAPARRST